MEGNYMFDFFKRQRPKQTDPSSDLAKVVERMFLEYGVTHIPVGNVFLTVIDGVHCSFQTILKCGEESHDKLFIYSQFPIPVPEHVTGLMSLELNRINERTESKSRISIRKGEGGYSVFAYTDCKFEKLPTTAEVKELTIHNVDLIDNENFHSLACAIFGYATYDEIEKAIAGNAKMVSASEAGIRMKDGYRVLHDKAGSIASSRYCGRLLVLSNHIIENRISKVRAYELLTVQHAPFLKIVQEAYNVADDAERDVC